MIRLEKSLRHWGQQAFDQTFLQETAALSLDQLPLQQALSQGSTAVDEKRSISINAKRADEANIIVRTSVFYCSIIAGCSCADDPTPIDLNSEYCELEFVIDRHTAATQIHIIG